MHLIRARDPSGKGLSSVLALRLLMLLLHWNPAMRPTPEQVWSIVRVLAFIADSQCTDLKLTHAVHVLRTNSFEC